MKIKRISFKPTAEQIQRYENLPRKINLSDELRKCLDRVLDKHEKAQAQRGGEVNGYSVMRRERKVLCGDAT